MFIPTFVFTIHDGERNNLALQFASLSIKLWFRGKSDGSA